MGGEVKCKKKREERDVSHLIQEYNHVQSILSC
jgi:hypothetical protein